MFLLVLPNKNLVILYKLSIVQTTQWTVWQRSPFKEKRISLHHCRLPNGNVKNSEPSGRRQVVTKQKLMAESLDELQIMANQTKTLQQIKLQLPKIKTVTTD